jgi:membrane associated rhomboid family serine protease
MLPIKDDQPRYSTPYINNFLIGLNLVIFLFEATLTPASLKTLLHQFAVVPAHVTAFLQGSPRYTLPAVVIPFFTSMFLHGSWMHVLGNMWFLYIFGDNVEDYLGHFKYLVFYLLAGLFAMTVQAAADPHSSVPTLGASGAIAGVLGAYFVLYPKAKVLTWLPPIFFFHLPAWVMLGYWFVVQFVAGATTALVYEGRTKGGGGIAFWAHVAGFLAGVVMIKVFPERQRRYPYAYR